MIPKIRSIPKVTNRLRGLSLETRERIEYLQMKEKYDRKKAELVELISRKAQNLQEVNEHKDFVQSEILAMSAKKSKMGKTVAALEEKIDDAKQTLEQESIRRHGLVNTVKAEIEKEKQILTEKQKQSEKLKTVVGDFQTAASELKEFIPYGKKAEEKYKELQAKISIAEQKYQTIQKETDKKMANLNTKNQELDAYYEYLKDLSGRLTINLQVVKEATEELNELLKENGVPIKFELPPNQIKEIKLYAA